MPPPTSGNGQSTSSLAYFSWQASFLSPAKTSFASQRSALTKRLTLSNRSPLVMKSTTTLLRPRRCAARRFRCISWQTTPRLISPIPSAWKTRRRRFGLRAFQSWIQTARFCANTQPMESGTPSWKTNLNGIPFWMPSTTRKRPMSSSFCWRTGLPWMWPCAGRPVKTWSCLLIGTPPQNS